MAKILGLATALMWGLSFISIKTAVAVVPPMSLGLVRFIVALAVLPLLALATKESLRVAAKDLPILALGGLFGVTLYFFCENNGVLLLSASEASLIIGTIPVATMLAERLVVGTKLGPRSYIGAILSFAGVGLIALRSSGISSSPMGFVYMIGAALAWVIYAFLIRPMSRKYGRITVTFWQSLFGTLGFLPFAIAEKPTLSGLGTNVILHILFLGVFCTALGYWFYIICLDTLGEGAASVFINLIPVISVIAAWFILGERLSAAQWAGAAVAITGVWLATTPGRSADSRSGPRQSEQSSNPES